MYKNTLKVRRVKATPIFHVTTYCRQYNHCRATTSSQGTQESIRSLDRALGLQVLCHHRSNTRESQHRPQLNHYKGTFRLRTRTTLGFCSLAIASLSTATTARGSILPSPIAAARFNAARVARSPTKSPNSNVTLRAKGRGIGPTVEARALKSVPSVREPSSVSDVRSPRWSSGETAPRQASESGATAAFSLFVGGEVSGMFALWVGSPSGAGGEESSERGVAPVHSSMTASTCSAH